MQLPTIHLNGTAATDLLNDQCQAMSALPADAIQLPCVLYLAADGCESMTFSVDSLTVAALAFMAYRDLHNLGSSQMAAHSGNIYGADRKTLVAKISYNGRAWSPDGELLAEAPERSK